MNEKLVVLHMQMSQDEALLLNRSQSCLRLVFEFFEPVRNVYSALILTKIAAFVAGKILV
jgi:hypothetical protein